MTSRLDELFEGYPTRLSVAQLAEILGVSKNTAYVWLRAEVVPAYQAGRSWVILRDEVRDWLATGRIGPAVPNSDARPGEGQTDRS